MPTRVFAAVVVGLVFIACATASKAPNRMVAQASRPIPEDASFVVVRDDQTRGAGVDLFQGLLVDSMVEKGYRAAARPEDAGLAMVFGFECTEDRASLEPEVETIPIDAEGRPIEQPRKKKDTRAGIPVTMLRLHLIKFNDPQYPQGLSLWSASGITEDASCNLVNSGSWLAPRMLEYLGQTVDPSRELVD